MERPLPYSSWCYVCGADNPLGHRVVFSTDGERVRLRYTPDRHRQGYQGVIHGGVLCTLLDEAMGWAPSLTRGRMYVTGELTTRFLRPFPVGREMLVEAWAEKVTARLALVVGEVRDADATVYATARGKFLPMDPDQTRAVDELLIYDADTVRLFGTGEDPAG